MGRGGRSRRRLDFPAAAPFDFTITLPNSAPIDYFSQANTSVLVRCERQSAVKYDLTAACPDADFVVTCPSVERGIYNVTCPGRKVLPLCTTWDGAEYAVNPACEVVAFNALNTTCRCGAATIARQRRGLLGAVTGSTEQEFSTTMRLFQEPYTDFFVAYPPILQVQQNSVIFATLLTVLSLALVGLLSFAWWDRNEVVAVDKMKARKTHEVRTIQGFFNSILPDEFRPGPWKQLLLRRIFLEHTWFSVLGPYHEQKGFRSAKWILAMCKLMTYLMVTTIIASIIFADDGHCNQFAEQECDGQTSFGGILQECAWVEDNQSCIFHRPPIAFDVVLLFVVVSAVAAVPLAHLVDVLLKRLFRLLREGLPRDDGGKYAAKGTPANTVDDFYRVDRAGHLREYWEQNDEMRDVQTTRSRMLMASRLRKMQNAMDFSLPTAEIEGLGVYVDEYAQDYGRRVLATEWGEWAQVRGSPTVAHSRYAPLTSSSTQLLRRVQLARRRAEFIKSEMEYMQDEAKEAFLLKHFIVDAFRGHQRSIASRYFLGSIQSTKRSQFALLLRTLSVLLLPIIFALLIYWVLVFNLDIGSRATTLWLFVTLTTLLEDVFVLQPLKIWLTWVVINSYVSDEAYKILVALKLRFASIMTRRPGVMQDALCPIQHLNPACRAARLFPDLPVSRFLMSVNDYDIPYFHPDLHTSSTPVALLAAAGTALVAGLTSLPFSVQDSVVDILGTVLINAIAISFYLLGSVVPAVAFAIVALLLLAFWVREGRVLQRLRKKKTIVDFKKILPQAGRRIAPVELVQMLDKDFDSKVLVGQRFKPVGGPDMLSMGAPRGTVGAPLSSRDKFIPYVPPPMGSSGPLAFKPVLPQPAGSAWQGLTQGSAGSVSTGSVGDRRMDSPDRDSVADSPQHVSFVEGEGARAGEFDIRDKRRTRKSRRGRSSGPEGDLEEDSADSSGSESGTRANPVRRKRSSRRDKSRDGPGPGPGPGPRHAPLPNHQANPSNRSRLGPGMDNIQEEKQWEGSSVSVSESLRTGVTAYTDPKSIKSSQFPTWHT